MATVSLSLNLRNKVISQYHSFEYASLFHWQGSAHGARKGQGLFRINEEYGNDNGADIDAFVEFATNDLGAPTRKTLRFMVMKYRTSGELEVTYTADDQRTRTVTATTRSNGGEAHGVRLRTGRDVYGTMFKFRVANVSGSNFILLGLYTDVYAHVEGHLDY